MGVEVLAQKTLLSEYDSNLLEASSTLRGILYVKLKVLSTGRKFRNFYQTGTFSDIFTRKSNLWVRF